MKKYIESISKYIVIAITLTMLLDFKVQSQSLDISLAAKQEFAPSVSFQKIYNVGKKDRFQIGWGIRANAFFSGEKSYSTAPALLTSGRQSIAAFFTEYNPAKIDTLNFTKTNIISINSLIILQYSFKKSAIGFNIDALGFTVGPKQNGIFRAAESPALNNSNQSAKPTPINVLLISDSDIGSLNSELYYSRKLKNENAIKFGLSFQFLEYSTENILTFENNRFRYKTLMPFFCYSFNLKK
jgi:hypothetical protein